MDYVGTAIAAAGWQGWVVANVIHGFTHGSRVKKQKELGDSFEMVGSDYDYRNTLELLVVDLCKVGQWNVVAVNEDDHFPSTNKTAGRALYVDNVDYFLYLRPVYYTNAQLNRLYFLVEVRVYGPDDKGKEKPRPILKRRYHYMSEAQGEGRRPFRPGEKQALLDEVSQAFDAQPDANLEKGSEQYWQRRNAIKKIEKSDTILPLQAIAESWTEESFVTEMNAATTAVTQMILTDIPSLPPAKFESAKPQKYQYFDENGLKIKIKAFPVESSEDRLVIRVGGSAMRSFPTDSIEPADSFWKRRESSDETVNALP
ncbi:MAG: hypothetical protein AAF351_11315 [Pseudomonadota bacterium]